MDQNTATITLGTLAFSGALGFMLPSLEKTWDASPSAPGTLGLHLTKSAIVFSIASVGAGVIGSMGTGSAYPLIVAVLFTLLTLHVYGEAFNYQRS